MRKLDFAEYIRRTDLINGCDRKHLNAWARTTIHGDQHLGIQIGGFVHKCGCVGG